MPRIARIVIKDEPAVYHVMSRTALDGLVRMHPDDEYSDDEIRERFQLYYGEKDPDEELDILISILSVPGW